MSYVINIILAGLKGPEKHLLYTSFQNILNNHYDAVFDIIHCFAGLTLKDRKEFNVFVKKEMPQDLNQITFSDKYKKAVPKFYEMLLANPECSEKFIVLLDTLPHNKESAIFVLKCKLRSKMNQLGGDKSEEIRVTNENVRLLSYAYYALALDFLIILGNNALNSSLGINVPYKTTFPKQTQTAGNRAAEYHKAVQPFADKFTEWLSNYYTEIKKNLVGKPGVKAIEDFFSAKNIGVLVNQLGLSLTVDTLAVVKAGEYTSDVADTLLQLSSDFDAHSEIKSTEKSNQIIKTMNVYKKNLQNAIPQTIEILCFIKNEYLDNGIYTIGEFDAIVAQEEKQQVTDIDFKCNLTGGSAIDNKIADITRTLNNDESTQTTLDQEIYYIVFINKSATNIISIIDSTEGASLRILESNLKIINREYEQLKSIFDTFKQILDTDPVLKN